MKRALQIGLLVACAALAQQPPRKQFKPPEILPLENPILAKDEGCAKDLARGIFEMEGLARQKHFAELFAYGCVRIVRGSYDNCAI
jgi:hypothetical protein